MGTSNVAIEVEGKATVTLEVDVDIDVAINNNVGARVTPRIVLELSSDVQGRVSAKTFMDVRTDMRLAALPTLGSDACAASFELARNQLKFPASTCVLDMVEDEACAKIHKLLAVSVPDAPVTKTVWSKSWDKTNLSK